jgi:hypothetical protein
MQSPDIQFQSEHKLRPDQKKQQRAVLSAGAGNGPAFLGTAPPVMVTDPGRIKQFGNAAADPGLVMPSTFLAYVADTRRQAYQVGR